MSEQTNNDIRLKQQQDQRKKRMLYSVLAVFALLLFGGIAARLIKSPTQPSNPTVISENNLTSTANQRQTELSLELEAGSQQPGPQTTSREALQAPLADIKEDIESLSQNVALTSWDEARFSAFTTQLDTLFINYAQGQYDQVKSDIADLTDAIKRYQIDYETAYLAIHQQAVDFFEQGNSEEAQLLNAKTLQVNPDFAPAKTLASRLSVVSDVNNLLRDVTKAEAEANLDEQQALLQAILTLDPFRDTEKAKLEQVSNTIRQRDFANVVSQAYAALGKNEIDTARELLTRAKQIDTSRSEISVLNTKITELERRKQLNSVYDQLSRLKEQERWQDINELSTKALDQFPNVPALRDAKSESQKIIDAFELLSVYTAEPERVNDDNMRRVVKQDLANTQSLLTESEALRALFEQVENILNIANTPVSVWFESDNQTNISVLTVGQVGKTQGRYVELLPGFYTIEGRRKGYKNKRVELTVGPKHTHSVSIICDEKI